MIIDRLYARQARRHAPSVQTIEINGRRARVVGFTTGIRTFTQSPYVFTSLKNARDYTLLPGRPDDVPAGRARHGRRPPRSLRRGSSRRGLSGVDVLPDRASSPAARPALPAFTTGAGCVISLRCSASSSASWSSPRRCTRPRSTISASSARSSAMGASNGTSTRGDHSRRCAPRRLLIGVVASFGAVLPLCCERGAAIRCPGRWHYWLSRSRSPCASGRRSSRITKVIHSIRRWSSNVTRLSCAIRHRSPARSPRRYCQGGGRRDTPSTASASTCIGAKSP